MPSAKRRSHAGRCRGSRSPGSSRARPRRGASGPSARGAHASRVRRRPRRPDTVNRRRPFQSTRPARNQPAESHQHEAHRAIAADPVAPAGPERPVDHSCGWTGSRTITASSFRRSCDAASIQWPRQPDARVSGARLRVVLAALAGNQDVAAREAPQDRSRRRLSPRPARRRAQRRPPASSKKNAGSMSAEIFLGAHALDENRANHAAPADQTRPGIVLHPLDCCTAMHAL